MKKAVLLPIFLFLSISFTYPFNLTGEKSGNPQPYEQLVAVAMTILEGNYSPEIKKNISPEAYIIYDNYYESLFEVLSDPVKRQELEEGKAIRPEYSQLTLSEDHTNAYLVLETRANDHTKTNWHTIYFKMGKNKQWQIIGWHAS